MKTLICSVLILLSPLGAMAGAFTSTASGLFSAGTTWVGGVAPSSAGDTWTISSGNTVVYDVDNSAGAGWGASVVTGTLKMTNTVPCYFKMNGTLSGAGQWIIGDTTHPIDFTSLNLPGVVIEFPGTVQCTMNGTGAIQWYGVTNKCFSEYLTNTLNVGDTSMTVSNIPSGLGSNDVFYIGRQTVKGQAGDTHFITNVVGNTIYFNVPASGNAGTNTWYGTTPFSGGIPTDQRTNGCWISFLSLPIVFMDKSARSTSIFTQSSSNVLSGVRIQNLGRGLATSASCSGWTVTSSIANNCNFGGFGNGSCSGWTVTSSIANNCSSGGFGNGSCSGWTVTSSTANNCSSGGLGYNNCCGWTVTSSTANNCSNGGFGNNNCSGWTVTSSTANNCISGGFGNSSCSGWTVTSSIANNCNFGGCGNGSCSGWTVTSSTANNCSNGGLGYNYCTRWILYGNTNNGSSPLFTLCWDIAASSEVLSGDTTAGAPIIPYGLIQSYNTSISDGGIAVSTNVAGRLCWAHIVSTNQPVPYSVVFSIRPFSLRSATISMLPTNAVTYEASIMPSIFYYPTNQIVLCPSTATGGWTNKVLSFSNTNSFPLDCTLWVDCTGTNGATGYSAVNLGPDQIVKVQ